MNPKEGLKAVARNPWVQRGFLAATVISAGACARPSEQQRPSENIPAAQGTITAQQKQIEALQTAIAQTKSAKPPSVETPKPAVPAPTPQERKEKEPISPIVLIPVSISEEKTPDFMSGKPTRTPEAGWKYVYVKFAVENKSGTITRVKLDRRVLNSSVLSSKEGFKYGNPVVASTFFGTRSDWAGHALNTLPPGFRVLGAFDGYLNYGTYPNDKEIYTNKVAFRVGEKTSDYKLVIPEFPEIDLTKGTIDIRSLKFPTDRPNSDFKEIGTSINVPGKGTITVAEISRELILNRDAYNKPIPEGGAKVKVGIRFHNESKGYGQKFNLIIKLFGEDGILYTAFGRSAIDTFPDQPLYWDGYVVTSGEIPPGNDRTVTGEIATSSTIKNGKLMVAGDINEIFNVQLPDPR